MLRIEKLRIGGLPPLGFEVRAGECLAVEGRSGSGKTRLLRAIADLDPAPGYVYLEGVERGEQRAESWRRKVRYVPAEPGWWAQTARAHAPRGPAGQRFRRLAEQLDIAPEAWERPIGVLSTGERRRLSLALAMCDDPAVLLLDEPALGLDGERTALLDELIRYQLLAGRVVLLVSHDARQVERLSHNRLLLTAPDKPAGRGARQPGIATAASSAGGP